MRTSIDFSDEMFHRLKTYAAMHRMTLKQVLHRAVELELARQDTPQVSDKRTAFPAAGTSHSPHKITGKELAEVFRTIPKPDLEFWDDVEEAIRNQPPATPPA